MHGVLLTEGQAVPGLFHFALLAAESALRAGLDVLRDAPAI
jgi:hypothetical protein